MAFDAIVHDLVPLALQHAAVPPPLIFAIVQELVGIEAVAWLPGVGSTGRVSYAKGGPQGRAEIPEVWNMVVEFALL
eukprot:7511608-Lingulodinium_polyedra.AAC.1